MKTQGVYRIRNTLSGRAYVGSSSDIEQRWRRHRKDLRAGGHHHAPYLQRAWAKHGSAAFAFEVVEECAAAVLIKREQAWIDSLQAYGPRGYNSLPFAASGRGWRHSDDAKHRISEAAKRKRAPPSDAARAKMSAAQKRRAPPSDETRAKLRATSSGRKHTEEAKRRMSEALTGKVFSEERVAKMRARVLSEAERLRLVGLNVGRKQSAESILKRSAQLRGKKRTAETRQRMSDAAKLRCKWLAPFGRGPVAA